MAADGGTGRGPWRPERVAVDLGGRVPPNQAEAERAVLSAVLTDRNALRTVRRASNPLRPGDMYSDANRRILEAAYALDDAGQPVDTETVAGWLKSRVVEAIDENGFKIASSQLPAVGGVAYLASLVDATPAVAHVAAHAAMVVEKSIVRATAEACQRTAAEAFDDYGDLSTFLVEARRRLADASERAHGGGTGGRRILSAAEAVARVDAQLRDAWAGKRDPWGIPVPWRRLNARLHGLELGSVTVITGRTSEGKSLVAEQAGINAAGRTYNGETIGVFVWSGEMPTDQWIRRGLVQIGGAPERPGAPSRERFTLDDLRSGRDGGDVDGPPLDPFKVSAIDAARATFARLPIEFDDSPAIDLTSLRMAVRDARERLAERGSRLRLVIVDHLHLMHHRASKGGTQAEAIGETCKGLKAIAMAEGVALVALAQYTLEATRADDRDPQNGDIKDAAAIMQIADVIMHVRRPWFRLADKSSAKALEIKEKAEIHRTKARDGKLGKQAMRFVGDALRFDEIADEFEMEG